MFGPVETPLYKLNYETTQLASSTLEGMIYGKGVYYYPEQKDLTKTNQIHAESYTYYLEHQKKKKNTTVPVIIEEPITEENQPNPLMAHPLFVPPDVKFISSMIDKNSPYMTNEYIDKSHAMVANHVDQDEEEEEEYPAVDESYIYHSEDESESESESE
mmetsp:Transcript_9377/g.13875  ORF Transcript_9377/g.13875 Transcript_9377/m.13875 type:complete len:159 (+) Transcript_9377:326-802(+)